MARSLKEQIEELSKPSNPDFDIEDTESNVFEGFEDDESDSNSDSGSEENNGKSKIHSDEHYVKVSKSKLRDNSINLGEKYEGKVASRDQLFDNAELDDITGESSDSLESEEEEDGKLEGDSGSEVSMDDSEDDTHTDSGHGDEDDDESYKRDRLKKLMNNERKHIVNRLSTSAKTDALKGYAILQQQQLFDQVLDTRMKLQKLLTSVNQLPVKKEVIDDMDISKKSTKQVKDKLFSLLDKVLEVRSQLYEREKIVKKSDTHHPTTNIKKRTFDEYLQTTSEHDDLLNKYRDNVLLKWSHKINSASGTSALNSAKFKNINQDTLKQVQNNLIDMDKLVKRTQLNRKNLKPIGGLILDLEQDDRSLQYSSYIFDDEDFYRVLLNDLIDKKLSKNEKLSSNLTISKNPLKLHKNYEKKASKGRKLNFEIQERLANFETPLNVKKWNDDQIDEFFASLLGQKVNMNEDDDEEEEEEDDNDDEQEDEKDVDTGLRIFG